LIDWDAATLIGDDFTDAMHVAHRKNDFNQSKCGANVKSDAWFLFVMEKMTNEERKDWTDINEMFNKTITWLKADEQMSDNFERWYDNFFEDD